MEKKNLLMLLFVVVAVASFRLVSKREQLDPLTLENIEALATSEWGPNAKCFGTGNVNCPKDNVKVYFVGSIGE